MQQLIRVSAIFIIAVVFSACGKTDKRVHCLFITDTFYYICIFI